MVLAIRSTICALCEFCLCIFHYMCNVGGFMNEFCTLAVTHVYRALCKFLFQYIIDETMNMIRGG